MKSLAACRMEHELACRTLRQLAALLAFTLRLNKGCNVQDLEQLQTEAGAAASTGAFSTTVPGWAAMQDRVAAAMQLLSSDPELPAAPQEPSQRAWDAALAAVKTAVQLWAQGNHAAAGAANWHRQSLTQRGS